MTPISAAGPEGSASPFADDVYQPWEGDQPGERFADMADALDEPDADALLDTGWAVPEKPRVMTHFGTTAAEERQGESLTERLWQEEAEAVTGEDIEWDDAEPHDDLSWSDEAGQRRAGRLVCAGGDYDDMIAQDVGVDGGAASAEEAAMHIVEPRERWD